MSVLGRRSVILHDNIVVEGTSCLTKCSQEISLHVALNHVSFEPSKDLRETNPIYSSNPRYGLFGRTTSIWEDSFIKPTLNHLEFQGMIKNHTPRETMRKRCKVLPSRSGGSPFGC